MKKSEYNATNYQERKAANLCVKCKTAINDSKYVTCKNCRDKKNLKHKTKYKMRKEQHLCTGCGNPLEKEATTATCFNCKEKRRKQRQEKYEHNKKSNLCITCREPSLIDQIYCAKCAEKKRQRSRKKAKRNKIKVMNYYGEVCFCCKESELDFLTIDHINENGAEHRKEIAGNSRNYCGEKFYAWLIRQGLPSGYQTACINCNIGKYLNNGICPHQKK